MLHWGIVQGLRTARRRRAALLALPCIVLTLASCSSRGPSEILYPTQGQVFHQGSPAAGALVILHPVNTQREWASGYPSGVVEADGKVTIKFAEWEGAPAGEYAILVTWFEIPSENDRTSEEGTVDKLGGRFANADAAFWRVKVDGAPCELPRIDLQ